MKRSRTGWLVVLVIVTLPLACFAVEEPTSYRLSDYDAPVPETLEGAIVVGDEAAYALWRSGRVAIIDVMPDLPRPKGLPKDVVWRGRSRYSIPGAIWMPEVGFGAIDADVDARFRAGLEQATGGDPDAPVLFLCRADCWMSWNAAKRAVSYGYRRVFWYPDGSTGWTFWEWPTERLDRPRDE